MKALSWINFILGLVMIVAGFALSAGQGPVMAQRIIIGIIIALLAAASARSINPAIAWCVALAGLWTLIAPAVMNYARFNVSRGIDIVVGIVVLVFGLANAVYRRAPARIHA